MLQIFLQYRLMYLSATAFFCRQQPVWHWLKNVLIFIMELTVTMLLAVLLAVPTPDSSVCALFYQSFCINSSIVLHFAAYLCSLLSTSILFSLLIFSFSAMGISPNSPNKSSISSILPSILPSALPSSLNICPNNVNDITPFKFVRSSAFKNLFANAYNIA